MTTTGPRTQKPVGSAAWVATEKENVSQLVDQEMEEVEYPVSHEMDWLNEHMADIFSNNQFNFTEVFKTPGKLRGKTPRTARKRNVDESRMPLSEIFSTAHNQVENKSNASPTAKRSPAKPAPPTTTTNAKPTTENESQPQYHDLNQNLNSFPQYNMDSGYHGMQDDNDGGGDDDDVVLTQVQPESQGSTQPYESQHLENGPAPDASQAQDLSENRRTTEASFHSAREEREQTAEPMKFDSKPHQKVEVHLPKPLSEKEREPEPEPLPAEPENNHDNEPVHEPEPTPEKSLEREPENKPEQAPEPEPPHAPQHEPEQKLDSEPEQEPESEREAERMPEPETQPESVEDAKPSPAKTFGQLSQPQPEEKEPEKYKEDMALDNLDDDIGSPSDGSTPERPPIRKSSLSFASLPAREPLTKKSLGGTRMSRTSHVDRHNTGSSFFGRQTGHRMTQAALDEQAQGDKMEVDDDGAARDGTDADSRASKMHNKSSTQRLHEKISMLGKLQPSRPTKSIPSVSGLSSAQVSYPELPPVAKTETKLEAPNRTSRDTPAAEPKETDEGDWIKPLNTPQRSNPTKSQGTNDMEKHSGTVTNQVSEKAEAPVARDQRTTQIEKNSTRENRVKSTTPMHSPPERPSHQKSASASNVITQGSTTPAGSPSAQEAPLSTSKWKLQSIMKSAKGLFSNTGGVSAAAKVEASPPDELEGEPDGRAKIHHTENRQESQPPQSPTPAKQEGRRTRSSTEREEKRRQKEMEDRQREEDEEKAREQEKRKASELKAAQEKASQEQATAASKIPPPQKHTSKEPESAHESSSKFALVSSQQQGQKPNERRPVKPTRDPLQKPRPVSIRVGSALSRQIPIPFSSSVQESTAPAPTPAPASKPTTIKKKGSNTSLHTASSNNSLKSSVSSNSQRKAQLASERKKEQEEREAHRKEEQKREIERKRAAQQEEARRQEARNRAEAERRERERPASVDPKKAAHMQAIEKRRLENAKRLERQGSQQPTDTNQPERPASQASRPASRLGSIQPFGRSINQPQPNPAKPPKRAMDDEPGHRPAPSKPSMIQPSGEAKRRRTEEEHNPPPSVRPTMAPPIRQSNIRKEPTKPSIFSSGQPSAAHQSGSSIIKTGQPQRPAHPMDMSKYASGKIPFAEPSNAQQPAPKAPSASSSQKAPLKPSPKYPTGENIQLPEIATDSEEEDSDAEMLPVPKWAQPKELESLLRQQEGMEVDSIFGPMAPFSLEETFKTDKKIKKFRERTSSANWSGADRLTQDEIRKDLADRQRLRVNGGWTWEGN